MKTLNDIKADMSRLYDELQAGTCEIKTASELANIAGKFLKAEQLDLAREIFISGRPNAIVIDAPHKPLPLATINTTNTQGGNSP